MKNNIIWLLIALRLKATKSKKVSDFRRLFDELRDLVNEHEKFKDLEPQLREWENYLNRKGNKKKINSFRIFSLNSISQSFIEIMNDKTDLPPLNEEKIKLLEKLKKEGCLKESFYVGLQEYLDAN